MPIAYSTLSVAQYAALSVAQYAALPLDPSAVTGLTHYIKALCIHAAGAVAAGVHTPGAQAIEVQQS